MPSSSPNERLSSVSSQLAPNGSSKPTPPTQPTMSSDSRPPITCHILDTLTGTPAASVPVSLTLLSPSASNTITFQSLTNNDGRITSWAASEASKETSLQSVFEDMEGELLWVCRFETRQYFADKGIKPFFPEVEIRFLTEGFKGRTAEAEGSKSHWHVPLLLGPFSYTTYRGS
jgi:5-hydroxyisourate hydrolase